MDNHGAIVRDYARDPKTWEKFKGIHMKLTDEFIADLYSVKLEKASEDAARKDQKETNLIMAEVAVVEKGAQYWRDLIAQAKGKGLLTVKEESILSSATLMDSPNPRFPSAAQSKSIMQIRERLGSEGIII